MGSDFDQVQMEADIAAMNNGAGEAVRYGEETVFVVFGEAADSDIMESAAFQRNRSAVMFWPRSESIAPTWSNGTYGQVFREFDEITYDVLSADEDEMGWNCRVRATANQ